LPLFIPLQRFTKAFDFTNLILATFQHHGITGIPYSAFEYLASAGRVVFLFDSFDEMAQTLTRGAIRTNLNELLVGIQGKSRAIMTSRPTYFDSRAERLLVVEREGQFEWHAQDADEYVRQTAFSRMLDAELSSVQFARLGDLTTKQRKQLFKIVLEKEPEALKKLNALYDRFQELESISQKAVIARLLTTVAMTLAAGREVKTPDGYPLIPDDLVKLNQGKVFEIVTNNLLDRDRLVGDLKASARLRFLRSFAISLQQPGSDFFAGPAEIRELVRNQFEALIRATDAPQQQLENYYRTCRRHSGLTTERQFKDTSGNIDIPVDEYDTDSRVGFSHNSLREYLVSNAIVDHVLHGTSYSRLETTVITELIGGFVKDASEYHPDLLNKVQQEFAQSDSSRELIFKIIYRLIEIAPEHSRLLGYPARLRYADICNLDLSELDLRSAEFMDCLAADTDFRKSDLRGATFHKTILQRVLFDGANLTDTDLRQADVQSVYVYDDFGRRTTAVLEGRAARQWLFSHGALVFPSNDLNRLLGDKSYEAAREVMMTLNKRIAGTHDESGLIKGTDLAYRSFAARFVRHLVSVHVLEKVRQSGYGDGWVYKVSSEHRSVVSEFIENGTVGPLLAAFFAKHAKLERREGGGISEHTLDSDRPTHVRRDSGQANMAEATGDVSTIAVAPDVSSDHTANAPCVSVESTQVAALGEPATAPHSEPDETRIRPRRHKAPTRENKDVRRSVVDSQQDQGMVADMEVATALQQSQQEAAPKKLRTSAKKKQKDAEKISPDAPTEKSPPTEHAGTRRQVNINDNETAVLRSLAAAPAGMHLSVLAAAAFPELPGARANSWVRNSVRKPLKHGLITQVDTGTYKITTAGKKLVD